MIVAFHTTHRNEEVNLGISQADTVEQIVADIVQQVKGICDSPVTEIFCYESNECVEVGFELSNRIEDMVFGELS